MPEVSLRGWGVAWRVGKRKRERNSSGLVLWPMFHHSQYFISVFEKKKTEKSHQTTQQMTQTGEMPMIVKQRVKYISVGLISKHTQCNI